MTSVLVIEDDDDLRVQLCRTLVRAGLQVWSERDGAEGLDTAHRRQPDVVVVDRMLPGLAGTQICTLLRGQGAGWRPYLLMMSAQSEEADREFGLLLGADAYLAKPVSSADLLRRIAAIGTVGP